jgi:Zn-dependent protease
MNIGLAIFNLLPVPPLDGSKILASILPGGFHGNLHTIEALGSQYGFIILYLLMFSGLLRGVFGVIYPLAENLLFLGM